MENETIYRVISAEDKFQVIDNKQQTIIECRDETNAHHYAVLLNKAYASGYKTGYKIGRAS